MKDPQHCSWCAGYAEALKDVEAEARKHLYTNTKNGNRQAILNIVSRLQGLPPHAEARDDTARQE